MEQERERVRGRERARGSERERESERERDRERQSVRVAPALCLYTLLPVCAPSLLACTLSHTHTHADARSHRPRERADRASKRERRENTSQQRCSRRFSEVRCLVVCLPSSEREADMFLSLFRLLVSLSHAIAWLFCMSGEM